MLTDAAGRSLRRELIELGSRRRRGSGAGRAGLDRAWRLSARGVENRSRGGEGAGRGPDLEIPSRNGAAARLPRGRSLRLRPLLRGFGVGGRGLSSASISRYAKDFPAKGQPDKASKCASPPPAPDAGLCLRSARPLANSALDSG
jgi:hypothetical protein